MADTPNNQSSAPKQGGYGKRPMWQWILLYIIIAIVLYGGVAYYLTHRHSSNGTSTTNSLY